MQGHDVYLEDGRVMRAVLLDENGGMVTAYPYRYDKTIGCWVNASGVKVGTLRSGMSRGKYEIR